MVDLSFHNDEYSATGWQRRAFGNTGLYVSALGFGAGHIGDPDQSEAEVQAILNAALEAGINLFDTARGYGLSEERIGHHLSWHREGVILATKVGYDIPGYEDWSSTIISAGVDAALQRLRVDHLDIVFLHSCPLDVLQQGDVIESLLRTVEAGKVRVAGYSGDNEPLRWAVESGHFGAIETSINIADQRALNEVIPLAVEKGMGVIAKRPIANAAWQYQQRPVGEYAEPYWERLQAMKLDPGNLDWAELALRFAAFQPGVHSCIVGTSSVEHLHENIAIIEQGQLPQNVLVAIRSAFRQHDQDWLGQT